MCSTRCLSFALLGATLIGCGDNSKLAPDGGVNPTPDSTPDSPPDSPPGDPNTGAWRAGFQLPGPSGFGSRVEAVAMAPDGRVVIAGIFQDVAGVAANNVAVWSGADWAPIGAGLDGWVRAAAFDASSHLWAAASAPDVQSAVLANWDGTTWTTAPALDGSIRDLAIVHGDIAVVGDFTGSVRVFHPATNTWEDVTPNGIVGAASAIAATTTGFCVAGQFDSINNVTAANAACWDGTVWTPLGTGLVGGVAVLARSPSGTWYAGGTLTYTVDPTTGAYQAGIAILNGTTWQPFQGGIDGGFINEVRAIAFDGNDVIVGGQFATAGTTQVAAHHLARWSPVGGWSEVGGGLINDVGVFLPSIIGTNDIVVTSNGTMWVGGLFTRAGGAPAVNLTRIPAAGAAAAVVGPHLLLGLGGFVDGLTALPSGGVVAGGMFEFGGTTKVRNLATLTSTGWSELGGGLRGIVRDVIALPNGHVIAAGELDMGGALAAIAEWDGTAWSMPGGRVIGVGFALAPASDGSLWLGGDLQSANGITVGNAIHLVGGTWQAAGTFDGRVNGLAVDGTTVMAVGSFTTIDATPAVGVAIRSGTSWSPLGGGLDGMYPYATSITISPALGVVIGGEFRGAGGVVSEDLARWDGTAWHDLGSSFSEGDYGFVSALRPFGQGLFIAGGFNNVGGGNAKNIAWYDGTTWHALGDGIADLAEAMIVLDDALYVGGPFTAAGGYPASGLAVWDFKH